MQLGRWITSHSLKTITGNCGHNLLLTPIMGSLFLDKYLAYIQPFRHMVHIEAGGGVLGVSAISSWNTLNLLCSILLVIKLFIVKILFI